MSNEDKQIGQTGVCLNQPSMPAEKNKYALLNFKRDENDTLTFQEITFYKLNHDNTFDNGTTLEEMLRVCIEKLTDLNNRFSCRENSIAITKMQEALMWLNKRTEDRRARGVEGKHTN